MATDSTPNLGLAFVMPSQAQREVTINGGLVRLDAISQLSVIEPYAQAVPSAPAEGQRWIVGPAPSADTAGPWAGRLGQIAAWYAGWKFFAPVRGWFCFVQSDASIRYWDGSEWKSAALGARRLGQLEDVSVPATPADRDVPQFDAGVGEFVSGPLRLTIEDLDKVDLPDDAAEAPNGAVPIYEASRHRYRVRQIGLADLWGVSGIGSEMDNYVLAWKAVDGPGVHLSWKPMPLSTGMLTDWATMGLGLGHIMRWNPAENRWNNAKLVLRAIDDTQIPADTNEIADGASLTWDRALARWKPKLVQAAAGATALSNLSDVSVSAPTQGQVLTYDATAKKWLAATPAAGSGGTGGSGTGGRTPPLAANFTYWLRRGDADQSAQPQSGVSDRAGVGMVVDILGRTNDKWITRFVGQSGGCIQGPSETICTIRPVNAHFFPFVKFGPMLYRSASRKALWHVSQAGRGDPTWLQQVEAMTYPADEAGLSWDTLLSTRASAQAEVSYRIVVDADGFCTLFTSLVGPDGPWGKFYAAKMDWMLGAGNSGVMPDQVGVAFTSLQETAFPFREQFVVSHWVHRAYTGASLPSA